MAIPFVLGIDIATTAASRVGAGKVKIDPRERERETWISCFTYLCTRHAEQSAKLQVFDFRERGWEREGKREKQICCSTYMLIG